MTSSCDTPRSPVTNVLVLLLRKTVQVQSIDRIPTHIVVIVCTTTVDGVDFDESAEARHILPCTHLDCIQRSGVFGSSELPTQPAVVVVAGGIVGGSGQWLTKWVIAECCAN